MVIELEGVALRQWQNLSASRSPLTWLIDDRRFRHRQDRRKLSALQVVVENCRFGVKSSRYIPLSDTAKTPATMSLLAPCSERIRASGSLSCVFVRSDTGLLRQYCPAITGRKVYNRPGFALWLDFRMTMGGPSTAAGHGLHSSAGYFYA